MKFKPYQQDLPSLFPLNFGDLIPKNDPVRILNQVVDSIELTKIEKTYKQGGCRAYNPKLLLKVIVYAYLRNTYSSRKIEDLVCNNR